MLEKSSIGFSGFESWHFWSKFRNSLKFWSHNFRGRRSCSTSYSSGKQVDGSPLVVIRKQQLSWPDWSPRKKCILSTEHGRGYNCTGSVVCCMSRMDIDVGKGWRSDSKYRFYKVRDPRFFFQIDDFFAKPPGPNAFSKQPKNKLLKSYDWCRCHTPIKPCHTLLSLIFVFFQTQNPTKQITHMKL